MGCDNPMSESNHYASSASTFLEEEVYRLASSPGLRSLPPGPERDFLTLTWGPVVYRTSYAPESKRLLPVLLRSLNDSVCQSLHRVMTGSDEEIRILTQTFASKIFSSRDMYADLDEDAVRQVFHDFKVSLAIPETELPSRLRVCLMIDDAVLSHLKGVLDMGSLRKGDAGAGRSWVKVVEENFPDSRLDDHPHVDGIDTSGMSRYMKNTRGSYHGWTMVALDALVEVFDGLRQLRGLVEYHQEGKAYLGEGQWSA
ncbi:hypothetical protein N7499_009567 [Penicillium canescens]|uniref:Uncharacterized protein n=1 Tax=Penicillium canescens TaxID=5083 RepID=A0AAD6NDZ8_PENCN|nr:uncharacterized protein N7446_008407 [Penicillium canescens]KAJ6019269.1 hypothetical protein N7522_001336 [Penicillium canescens]KAJ6033303.1 hypothetical protein N7444_011074 [Penicillium canescens]KAJ6057508.1 hypothetical protein N7460_000782 [Penicillium canescens]KAJ6058824.1 hypothetical protein N7446_008407 [Penicillium canescens]KAJ6071553.1 hypothetical protein N7499_009567 [Penicillium canescens]